MVSFRKAHTLALAALLSCASVSLAQDLPDAPYTLTVDSQTQYANAVYNPKRVVSGELRNDPAYWTLRLRQEFKIPIKYSWDASAVKFLTDKNILMIYFFEDIADDLGSGMTSTQSTYLKGPLSKIKEIHLTTTPKKRTGSDDITSYGFFPTFNKSSGVLTVAISSTDGYNRDSQGGIFSPWVMKNIK